MIRTLCELFLTRVVSYSPFKTLKLRDFRWSDLRQESLGREVEGSSPVRSQKVIVPLRVKDVRICVVPFRATQMEWNVSLPGILEDVNDGDPEPIGT